jgi:hypothetical protein
MKKLLIGLTLLASMSAYADWEEVREVVSTPTLPLKSDIICATKDISMRLSSTATEIRLMSVYGGQYDIKETGTITVNNKVNQIKLNKRITRPGESILLHGSCDWQSSNCTVSDDGKRYPRIRFDFIYPVHTVTLELSTNHKKVFSKEECVFDAVGEKTHYELRQHYVIKRSPKRSTSYYTAIPEAYSSSNQSCTPGWDFISNGAILRRTKNDCSTFTIIGDGGVIKYDKN